MEDSKFTVTIYLKSGATVTTTTTNPEEVILSLSQLMDKFHRRGLFRSVNSVVAVLGLPRVFVPIEHINFYTVTPQNT